MPGKDEPEPLARLSSEGKLSLIVHCLPVLPEFNFFSFHESRARITLSGFTNETLYAIVCVNETLYAFTRISETDQDFTTLLAAVVNSKPQ